jgi:hypothetical protein
MSEFIKKFEARRLIWIIFIEGISIHDLYHLNLPNPISEDVKRIYDYVENLPDGSVIGIGHDVNVGWYLEIEAGVWSAFEYLFNRNFTLVIWHVSVPDSVVLVDRALRRINMPEWREYGENWVWLGYAPGGAPTCAALAKDVRKVYHTDIHGTPIDEIPAMEKINSAEDFDLIFVTGFGTMYALYWAAPYHIPTVSMEIGITAPRMRPYVPHLVMGVMNGLRGAGEWEVLTGTNYGAIGLVDSSNIAYTLYFIFIIIGNYQFFKRRRERRSEEKNSGGGG